MSDQTISIGVEGNPRGVAGFREALHSTGLKNKMTACLTLLLEKVREPFQPSPELPFVWSESPVVCALSDSERHLGHAIRAGQHWIAYDAIHVNSSNNGFRVIGTFETIAAAKDAIENAVRLGWVWAIAGANLEREAKTYQRDLRPDGSATRQP